MSVSDSEFSNLKMKVARLEDTVARLESYVGYPANYQRPEASGTFLRFQELYDHLGIKRVYHEAHTTLEKKHE